MKPQWWHVTQLIAVAALAFGANLGGPKLWDEDEPRNAACALEMLDRADWVVPYFNGEVRDHKPVLLYWLMMVSYSICGENEFAARLPSACFALGTVLLTYSMGRRMFGASTGLLAGTVLATTLMFVVASRAATPDSVLIFLSTAALAIYVNAVWRRDANDSLERPHDWFPTDRRAVVILYAVMGLAVLAKGPVGFLLPTAVIGMFLLVQTLPTRRARVAGDWTDVIASLLRPFHPMHFVRTCVRMKLWIGLLAILVVALPWYVHVTLRSNWEWTRGFFLEHNLGRATRTMENHGGPPVLYYVVALSCGFFPWSAFLGPWFVDLKDDWRNTRFRAARTFALCWVGVYLGLFSLASTKLPSYITPCYPALALLIGHFLERLGQGRVRLHKNWLAASCVTLAFVGIAIAVGVPLAATQLLPGTAWLGTFGLVLLFGAVLLYAQLNLERHQAFVRLMATVAVVFVTLMFGVGANKVSEHQQIQDLIAKLNSESEQPVVAAFAGFRSSWVFYTRQTIPQFHQGHAAEAQAFLEAGNDHFLIVPRTEVKALEERLSLQVVSEVDWFLERDSLLLVKRDNQTTLTPIAQQSSDQSTAKR